MYCRAAPGRFPYRYHRTCDEWINIPPPLARGFCRLCGDQRDTYCGFVGCPKLEAA